MTLADSLKPLARSIRGIPGTLGIRPHRVYLVTETWSGARPGLGEPTRTEFELVEGGGHPPKVRELSDEVLALGNLPQGSIEIGPITAHHGGVGVTAAELEGDTLDEMTARKLRISGPMGNAWYVVTSVSLDRAIHWTIKAQPLANPPQAEPPDDDDPESP